MKSNDNMNNKFDTLAPCGVYCGACPSFKRHVEVAPVKTKSKTDAVSGVVKLEVAVIIKKVGIIVFTVSNFLAK